MEPKAPPQTFRNSALSCSSAKARCTLCLIGTSSAFICQRAAALSSFPIPRRSAPPARFPAEKRRPQHQSAPKRQSAEQSSAGLRSSLKKKPGKTEASLLASVFSGSFSYQLPRQRKHTPSNANAGFRGELERGLWPSKAALSIVPHHFFSFLNKYSSTLPRISSLILRSMGNTSAPSTRRARCSACLSVMPSAFSSR